MKFGAALMEYLGATPEAGHSMPFILAKTLGRSLGSVHQASFWGRMQNQSPVAQEAAARVGFTPGPKLGDDIFQAALDRATRNRADPEDPDFDPPRGKLPHF